METTTSVSHNNSSSNSGAQLIVRVKRRREDDPAETICLYDDNHNDNNTTAQQAPLSKRNRKSLVEEMAQKVSLNEDSKEENQPPVRRRLMLQRISTLETFSYATLDQDTAVALSKKRARDVDDASNTNTTDKTNNETPLKPKSDIANDREETETALKRQRRVKLLVAQSKKTTSLSIFEPFVSSTANNNNTNHGNNTKTSCVIVDTMQIFDTTTIDTNTTLTNVPSVPAESTTTSTTPAKKKILTPPTRLLAQAIVTAVTRNDFNDLSRALIQGADINHQLDLTHPTCGGYTALMAAASRGNLRIVKRLLLDSSLTTVLARNTDKKTALELLPKPSQHTVHELTEMRLLLEQASIKQHQQEAVKLLEQQRQQQKVQKLFQLQEPSEFANNNTNPSNTATTNHANESVFTRYTSTTTTNTTTNSNMNNTIGSSSSVGSILGDDFVVDIYIVNTSEDFNHTKMDMNENHENTTMDAVDNDNYNNSSSDMFSILRVDGLKIDDTTGQVELVAYDSDWSDLADDEEPDSNDERFYGNDYPDESDEDNGGRKFSGLDLAEDQDVEDGVLEEDDNHDSDNEDDDVGMGSHLQRRKFRRTHRHFNGNNNNNNNNSSSNNGNGNSTWTKIVNKDMAMDENDDSDTDHHTNTEKKVSFKHIPPHSNKKMDMDDDADNEEEDEEDIEMDLAKELNSYFGDAHPHNQKTPDVTTLFDRQSRHVTRIMRPFQLENNNDHRNSGSSSNNNGHTTESLQELWGQNTANTDITSFHNNTEINPDHAERVQGMRERTGMVFAANVHEFDRETGLPKYGQDLSDNEDLDLNYYTQNLGVGGLREGKPPLTTVAYDSELDNSD